MIINLTKYRATPEQAEAGVVDLPNDIWGRISGYFLFDHTPSGSAVSYAAYRIALLLRRYIADTTGKKASHDEPIKVLIDGPVYLIAPLEHELREWQFQPVYASPLGGFIETLPNQYEL